MSMSSFKLFAGAAFLAICLSSFLAPGTSAQTTITYTYDANGRMVSAASTAGHTESAEYDRAGNITNAASATGGGGGNFPPTCTANFFFSLTANKGFPGLATCIDANGDTLTLTNVSDPIGSTTASISGTQVFFTNLRYGSNETVVTVSDGNGGTDTFTLSVYR